MRSAARFLLMLKTNLRIPHLNILQAHSHSDQTEHLPKSAPQRQQFANGYKLQQTNRQARLSASQHILNGYSFPLHHRFLKDSEGSGSKSTEETAERPTEEDSGPEKEKRSTEKNPAIDEEKNPAID